MVLLTTIDIGRYDAAANLAYNEACLERVEPGNPILRIFTFSKPGLILAKHESLWDVRDEYHGITTRRHTAGSVIYVDPTTLGYTVVFHKRDMKSGVTDVYNSLTLPLVKSLCERGVNAELGSMFSIRINGKVVAGHAQFNRKDRVQYDGIIHIEKPNVDAIESAIKLRSLHENGSRRVVCIDGEAFDLKGNYLGKQEPSMVKLRDEREEISNVSGLREFGVTMQDYIEIIRRSFESVFGMQSVDFETEMDIQLLEEKYRSSEWVSGGSNRCLGHCFVDFIEEESKP